MPIYEFYCRDCHTIFNFFSRRVNTEKTPDCPSCRQTKLERQVSLFSVSKGRTENEADDIFADMDESKLEKAMMSLAGEMENMNEEDPKQAAHMMRRLFDSTGMKMGEGMEEAIRRMEAGEDPETIEEDMGDVLEQEDSFSKKSVTSISDLRRKYLPPRVDETLYEL